MKQKGLAPLIIIIIVALVAGSAYWGFKSGIITISIPQRLAEVTATPTPTPDKTKGKRYVYEASGFSFNYPNDWSFLDSDIDAGFPLKERLTGYYDEEKVVALSKRGIYLIFSIQKTTTVESGGIFSSNEDFQEFISNKDKIIIGGSTFYLSREHPSIPSLNEAHDGPAMWGTLVEFIPNRFKDEDGYDIVIKRKGYIYILIVAASTEGPTDTKIQREIIEILQTIEW